MLSDITIGQFFPGKSTVHRIDPRMKLILIVAFIVVLFVIRNAFSFLLLAISLGARYLARRKTDFTIDFVYRSAQYLFRRRKRSGFLLDFPYYRRGA